MISIHAPTNGATNKYTTITRAECISIHAPTNGATFCSRKLFVYKSNFNPRSDERSDIYAHKANEPKRISIHAPTNGATA